MSDIFQIYESDDHCSVAIRTNIEDERKLKSVLVDTLQKQIEERTHADFWSFYLDHLLDAYLEIVLSLRGYKADVIITKITQSGAVLPDKSTLAAQWSKDEPILFQGEAKQA